jgi:hypothetical protein
MANLSKIFENKYQAQEKESTKELQEYRIRTKLADTMEAIEQPYSASRRPHYTMAKSLTLLGNLYSFMTGAFCAFLILQISIGFMPKTMFYIVATIIAISSALVLELCKRLVNNKFWFYLLFFGRMEWGLFTAGSILTAISITSSFYVASTLPTNFAEKPVITDIDSVKNYFDAQIAEKQRTCNELAQKSQWKGTITSDARSTIKELQTAIISLEQKRDNAIAAEKKANEEIMIQHNQKTANWGSLLGYITISTELLFILCFWYQNRYLYKCAKERGFLGIKADPDPIGQIQNMSIENRHQNPIGFNHPPQHHHQNPVITSDTVFHTNKITGETQAVTLQDIQRFINTYQSRVGETLEKIKENPSPQLAETLANRMENLQYWNSKKEELFTKKLIQS